MTDSLSVQPQIQKKDNTVPYGVAGAAIGGVGGAVAANYGYGIPRKPDLDKVFAMDPDTFKRNIEKAGENKGAWETAQEYANKIQEAEKEYEAKWAEAKERLSSQATLDNLTPEDKAKYETAKNNYDAKLKDLIKDEKAKLEAANKKTVINSIPQADNTNLKGKNKRTYDKLRKEYQKQLEAVRNSNEYRTLNVAINETPKELEKGYKIYSKQFRNSNKPIEEYFAAVDKNGQKTSFYEKIRRNAVEPLLDQHSQFKDKTSKAYKARAHEITMQMINEHKKYAELEQQLLNYDSNFKITKPELTGVHAKNLNDLTSTSAKEYKELRDKMKNKKMGNSEKKNLMTKYNCNTETELINLLDNRYGLANKYEIGKNNIEKEMQTIGKNNVFTKDFVKQRNKLYTNKHITEAKNKIVEQFPDLFKQGATLSADEIATKAETNAKEAIKKLKISEEFENAKKLAEEAAEKLGKTAKQVTDEEIIKELGGKTKEEFVKAIKDEAKENVGKNLEKMKIANKTWTGLAAAAALGLAGMGIAMMNKKDA